MRRKRTVYLRILPTLIMMCLTPCVLAAPSGYAGDTRAYNLAHGRVVFTEHCLRCHESGRRDAPVVGDSDDWKARIGQPLETLIRHAIDGHGCMPPRGDQDISDQDVAAAVAFVVDRVRLIAVAEGRSPPAVPAEPERDELDRVVVQMFLMLFGKERWK